jgi:hypothetical protein
MRVRRILFGAALVVALVPATARAQETGEIGGPPTLGGHLPFPPPHKKTFFPKATSEPIVIGAGPGPLGRVEIVGQGSKGGLCIFIDHPKQGSGSGGCGRVAVPNVIAPDTFTWETRQHRSKSLSELSGFMHPTVASVTAVAHRRKGHKRTRKAVSAIVAVPSPELLSRLHQATPFGFFLAGFRGCLADAKMRFHAFDAAGLLLGTSHLNLAFPGRFNEAFQPCEPGSSGFAFFLPARAARTAVPLSAPPGPSRTFASPGSAATFAIAR